MVNKCVMSITLNLLATAADSAPYATMAAGSDPEAVEDPVATGDAKTQSQPSNHTPANLHHSHYIGLPYQDHNYGAPPPPTPPASPPPKLRPVSPSKKLNGFLDDSSNVSTLSNATNGADDGVTRCICNFEHDDGYMISCDKCLSWQHVECMGLDRNNIPDCYFCEKCLPRSVDVQKAVALQTKKRENMSEDSSSTDSEESTAVNPTTYTAISNSPTSLTLTTHHKNKKSKKKKRKREHSERSHKKKKKKHDKKSRTRSLSSELNLFDEDAQAAWIQSENSDEYEDASKNEYTAELQKFIAAVKPDIECTVPHSRVRAQFADIGAVSIGRKGLIAKERIMEKQTILEYRGKVMLKKQLLAQTTFFSASYRYVLFYSRFGNIDICVDARVYGNKARYVRRSCSPNTEVLHNTEGDLFRLFLVSCKEIPKDSEITIGFDINHKECPVPVECACGKKNCAVKKHHKHRHESGERKKNHKNNYIKKEDSNSCSSHPVPLSARRRTVSPLRVSLSNQLVQNSVIDITPAKMTEDEEMQTEVDVETEENQPESNRKLTREERKMEAIMKAFEKMERTQKRRQQALDRLAIAKDNESQSKAKPLEEVAQTTDIIQVDQSNEEAPISSLQQAETQPNAAAKPPVVKRKKKTRYNSTPRRRTRNNSAASIISTEIKPLEQSLSSLPATPITSMPSFFSSNSSPGVAGLINNNDRLLPLVSPVTCNSKHFKFPKTKKLFLNEWLNEKAQEACMGNPLSISTDPVDLVDSASPNTNYHSQLARSNSLSALAGKSGPEASLGSAKKRWLRLAMNEAGGGGGDSPVGSGALSPSGIFAGSAMSPKSETITPLKKRWLRISVSDDQTTALCSAATSASSSPLHPSLDTDCMLPSTSSVLSIYPKPNVSTAVEENLLTTVASSSLILKSSEDILKDDQKMETKDKELGLVDYSNELLQTKCKEKNESNQQDQQAVQLILSPAHEFQEGSGTIKPLPLALPAKKDFRKNSSIDSGLSVTTPMDISESPKYFSTDNVHNFTDQNKVFNSSENAIAIVPNDGRNLMQSERAPLNELLTETKPSNEALHLHSKSDQNRPNRPSLSTERTLVSSSEGSILAKAELDINKSLSSSHGTVYSLGSGDASQTDLQESVSSLSDLQQSWSSVSEYAVSGNSKSLNHMDKDHLGNDIIAQTAQGTLSDGLNVSQRVCPNTVRTLNFQSPKKIGPESARSSLEDQTSDLSQSSYTSPKKRALMFMRESENPTTGFSAGWRDSASEQLPQTAEIENKLQENCLGEKTDGGKPVPSTPTSLSLNIGSGIPSVQPLPYPIEGVVISQVNSGTVAPIAQLSHYPAGSVPVPVSSEPGVHHSPCPIVSRPGVPIQSLPYSVGSANSTQVKVSQAGSSALPEGTPPVTPPVGSQSPAGTPAVKKKVSLLEYRKRKTTAKPTPTSSDPSTPVKSLTSSLSKSTENTPVKMPATLPTLPLFDTPPPVEKDISGKGLRLSTEAEKAISSLTSLLKDTGSKTDAGDSRRSSIPVAENAVTQYKGLSEKMPHRIGPNHNLKRSRSPEPPPPPPNKKHNLQLHIPPPPPPKSKATVDSRGGGFNNTDSTPPPPFGRQNSYQASPVASASARNNTGMQMYPQQSQYHASSSSSSPRGHQTSLSYPVQPTHPSQANSNQPLNTTFLGYHEQGNLAPAPTHQGQSTSQQYYNETYQVFPQPPTNVAPQGVNFQQQHRPQGVKPTFSKQTYGHSFSPRRGYYQSQ